MNIRSLIILILSGVVVYSCKSNSTESYSAHKTIDIENNIDKIEVVKLSDVAKSIDYIPLETSDSVLISDISRVAYENNRIFVMDKSKIFVFDNNGKHIRTLNKLGRGPGEYQKLLNFKIVKGSGSIITKDMLERINIYDSLHNYVNSIDNPRKKGSIMNFENFGDTLFVGVNTVMFNNFHTESVIFDHSSRVIDSGWVRRIIVHSSTKNGPSLVNPPIIFKYDSVIRYFDRRGDTIFSYNNRLEKSIAYILKMGEYKEPENITYEDFNSKDAGFISVSNLAESNNCLFMNLILRGYCKEPTVSTTMSPNGTLSQVVRTYTYGIYDKSKGKLTMLAQPVKGMSGVEDDLKNGPPFWPKYINSESDLISTRKAYEIITYAAENDEAGEYIRTLAAKLNENSNPVVIIARTR